MLWFGFKEFNSKMIEINLLDWREKRKFVQNNRFFVLIGAAVFACVFVIFLINMTLQGHATDLQSNVAYLSGEISSVQQKIEQIKDLQAQKDLLLERREVVETLQASRTFIVKIFDNLSRVVPSGVVLNEMTRKDNLLSLSGIADSNGSVSALMKSIARLRWVKEAKLTELKNVDAQTAQANTQDSARKAGSKAVPNTQKVEFKLEVTMEPTGVTK